MSVCPVKRAADARKPVAKRHMTAEQNDLLEGARTDLESLHEYLDHEASTALDSVLQDELAVDCAVHRRVAALLDEAPAECRRVAKPRESYDDTIKRAAAKVAEARELLADVASDEALLQWSAYIDALVESSLV